MVSDPSSLEPGKRGVRWLPLVMAGCLLLGLVITFVRVLELRFSSGEIYPHYSTLRSDPLGTRALVESLQAVGGRQVDRNLEDLSRIKGLGAGTTLVLAGLPWTDFDDLRVTEEDVVIEGVRRGARLVITLNPGFVPLLNEEDGPNWLERREAIQRERREASRDEAPSEGESEDGEGGQDEREEEKRIAEEEGERLVLRSEELPGIPFLDYLGLALRPTDAPERPEEGWVAEWTAQAEATFGGDPPDLPLWKSQYRFKVSESDEAGQSAKGSELTGLSADEEEAAELSETSKADSEPKRKSGQRNMRVTRKVGLNDGESWRVLAAIGAEPAVVERTLGEGSVVLVSDSYFLSNESLWRSAKADFILWLLGEGSTRVLFDETIHGGRKSSGVMMLIWRYRLHGIIFGLLIFVALLAWRSSSSLVPVAEQIAVGEGDGEVVGDDAASGMQRLLRRSIRPAVLLRRCFEVWSRDHADRLPPGQRAEVERLINSDVGPRGEGTVAAYSAISEGLRRGRGFGKVASPETAEATGESSVKMENS